MGHVRNYTITDVIARFKKMQGYEVFQPMGFDAFGLPAENYAIKTGIHPKDSTEKNIETMEQQLRNMGGVEQMLGMMPGGAAMKDVKIDEKAMAHMEAIIRSMTMKERVNPEIINSSRKQRIAKGSGTSVEEVNKLLRQFEQMKKMMKQFPGMMGGKGGKRGRMRFPF